MEEPFNSLSMLINFNSLQYIVRVLGKTRERSFLRDGEDLDRIVTSVFSGTVTCVGNPALRGDSAIEVFHPFHMVVSTRCLGYYTLAPGERALQGRGRCVHCKQEEDDEILSSQRVLRFEDPLFHIFGIEQNSNFSDITDSIDFISSYFDSELTAIYQEEVKMGTNNSSSFSQLALDSDTQDGLCEEMLESHHKIEGCVIRLSKKLPLNIPGIEHC